MITEQELKNINSLFAELKEVKELLSETIYRAQFMLPTTDRDLKFFDDGADVTKSNYIERLYAFMRKYQPESFGE